MFIEMIDKLGINAKLANMDIKSAFRLLTIAPRDFDLLGFQLKGQYYQWVVASHVPNFATFLHWMEAQNVFKNK